MGFYPGEYLISAGQKLADLEGDKWKDVPEIKDTILTYCNENEIKKKKKDLFNS